MKRCTALNYKFQPCTDSVLLAHAPTLQTPSTSTCTYNIMLPELQKQNTDTNFVTSNTHLSTITRKEKNMLKWAIPGNFFVWHLHCFTSTWLSRHSEWKERNNLVHQGLHSVSVLMLPPPPFCLGLGCVQHINTSKNNKAWAVSSTLTPARTSMLGLCPPMLGLCPRPARTPRLGLRPTDWHQQEHQGLGCVQQIDTNKNTKAWAASNRLTPTRTPRLGLRPTDWHQQEHQGLGCIQQIDTNKNTKAWAVLTPTRTPRLGLRPTDWHQQEHQGLGCVNHALIPTRTPRHGLCYDTLTPARTPWFGLCPTPWHQHEHQVLGCVQHVNTILHTQNARQKTAVLMAFKCWFLRIQVQINQTNCWQSSSYSFSVNNWIRPTICFALGSL